MQVNYFGDPSLEFLDDPATAALLEVTPYDFLDNPFHLKKESKKK